MKQGIIFDMDGTLFDTEKYYNCAWKKARRLMTATRPAPSM